MNQTAADKSTSTFTAAAVSGTFWPLRGAAWLFLFLLFIHSPAHANQRIYVQYLLACAVNELTGDEWTFIALPMSSHANSLKLLKKFQNWKTKKKLNGNAAPRICSNDWPAPTLWCGGWWIFIHSVTSIFV